MDPERDLAGSDSLLPAAQEQGNIRCTGADIKDHETAAGILSSTKPEVRAKGRAFRGKSNGRLLVW